MRTLSVLVISLLLAVAGLGLFLWKVQVLEFPLKPDAQFRSWYVEATFNLRPDTGQPGQPVQLEFFLPRGSGHLALVDENFVSSGFGHDERLNTETRNREVTFSKRAARTAETIVYRASIFQVDSGSTVRPPNPPEADDGFAPANRARLDRAPDDPVFVAIDSLLEEARARSADEASLIREIYKLAGNRQDDRTEIIVHALGLPESTPPLANFLINTAGIPARVVHGIDLQDQAQRLKLLQMTEVWFGNRWQAIDAGTGQLHRDSDFLPWWYGDATFYDAKGGFVQDVRLSVKENIDNSLTRALWKADQQDNALLRYSLFNLPISTQLVLQLLLLIPIGGLVIAFMRQIIGITTFGTFMPVLVALAFRETGLVAGVVLFTLIVALGLLIRGWFNQLQLLLVPRLASVLTIVVLIIAMLTLVINHLGLEVGLSLSLFPIVILTMTIERMSLLWEESGGNEAIRTGLGSLVAAGVCYYAMYTPIVGHLVFTFPELLLVVLALTILMGRYNGYKLTEYGRFKALQRQIAAKGKA